MKVRDLRTQFANQSQCCTGLPDDVSAEETTGHAESIAPELIFKPCARLTWCPYGVESLERTLDVEPDPDEGQECTVFETVCPAYLFGNHWCDTSAEDPGYTDDLCCGEGDEHFVILCRECYENLITSASGGLM